MQSGSDWASGTLGKKKWWVSALMAPMAPMAQTHSLHKSFFCDANSLLRASRSENTKNNESCSKGLALCAVPRAANHWLLLALFGQKLKRHLQSKSDLIAVDYCLVLVNEPQATGANSILFHKNSAEETFNMAPHCFQTLIWQRDIRIFIIIYFYYYYYCACCVCQSLSVYCVICNNVSSHCLTV